MALFGSSADHVELNGVDKSKNPRTIFPFNTVEDVLVNENGTFLSEVLPSVQKNGAVDGYLDSGEVEEETIMNEKLITMLTTDTAEDFSDVDRTSEPEEKKE